MQMDALQLILAVIGTIVAVYAFMHEKSDRKALAFQVLSEGSGTGSGASLVPDDAPTHQQLIRLLVRNSGTRPILETDFVEPLTMQFAGEARLHQASVGRTIPSDLKIRTTTTDKELSVVPALLNPKDSFEVDAIVEGYSGVTPRGRIVGVANIDVVQWQGSAPEVFTRRVQGFTNAYVRDPRVTRTLGTVERLFDRLPRLRMRKTPLLAALLGFLAGGIGIGIYFRSWLDFGLVFVPAFLLTYVLPDGWWIVFSVAAAAYGYFRAFNSNRRLIVSPGILLNDLSGFRPETV